MCFLTCVIEKLCKNRVLEKLLIILIIFLVGSKFHNVFKYFQISRAFEDLIWIYFGFYYQKYNKRINEVIYNNINFLFFMTLICFFTFNVYDYNVVSNSIINSKIKSLTGIFFTILCIKKFFLFLINIANMKIYKIILEYSFEIYLFSDTINYVLIAALKNFHLQTILLYKGGCVIFFLLRCVITIILPIIIGVLLKNLSIKESFN